MIRIYPSNAARGGATTLTGAGSANDVFTFATPVLPRLQNNTAAIIYVAASQGAGTGATQGDEAVLANGGLWAPPEDTESVAIYGAATTHVNGTATLGIVLYGLSE